MPSHIGKPSNLCYCAKMKAMCGRIAENEYPEKSICLTNLENACQG